MGRWGFIAAIMPPLIAALIAGGIGAAWLAHRLTADSIVPAALVALLLFVAMTTFKRVRGWNAALLAAFSFVGCAVIAWLFEGRVGGTWPGAVSSAALILAFGAFLGRRVRSQLARIGAWLWLLSWVYLFGWVAGAALAPAASLIRAWAIGGLVIYGGLSAAWFAGLDLSAPDPSGTAWAIDLTLLGFNLAIAARVVMWKAA